VFGFSSSNPILSPQAQFYTNQAWANYTSIDLDLYNVVQVNGFTGPVDYLVQGPITDPNVPPAAADAPEPTTMALIGLPIIAFGIYRKRKSSATRIRLT
jgi:hypothetical protein